MMFYLVQNLKVSLKVFIIDIPGPGKTTLAEALENYCAIMTTESSVSIGPYSIYSSVQMCWGKIECVVAIWGVCVGVGGCVSVIPM